VVNDSSNALMGKRVVVTRAAEQSVHLMEALRDKGAVPVVLPMVAFGPPDDAAELDRAIVGLGSYDWIFLTSQNALRALQERGRFLKMDLQEAMGGIRIAAVGPATAEAVESAGLQVAYVAAKHTGVSLAEELANEVKGRRVFLPRSDRANPELVEKLRGLGVQVTEVVAYRTIHPDKENAGRVAAVVRGGVDAILFFSPSAVHHFQELLGIENFVELSRRSAFAAIGPVTAGALRKAKIERVLLSQDTTVTAVISALANYFSQAGTRQPAGVKQG
jgi:uroporphyrinogen III methyltransferase/synthase